MIVFFPYRPFRGVCATQFFDDPFRGHRRLFLFFFGGDFFLLLLLFFFFFFFFFFAGAEGQLLPPPSGVKRYTLFVVEVLFIFYRIMTSHDAFILHTRAHHAEWLACLGSMRAKAKKNKTIIYI